MSRPQKVNGAIFHLLIMEGNIRSALKMTTFDRGAQLQKTTEANGEFAKVNPRGRRISLPYLCAKRWLFIYVFANLPNLFTH